ATYAALNRRLQTESTSIYRQCGQDLIVVEMRSELVAVFYISLETQIRRGRNQFLTGWNLGLHPVEDVRNFDGDDGVSESFKLVRRCFKVSFKSTPTGATRPMKILGKSICSNAAVTNLLPVNKTIVFVSGQLDDSRMIEEAHRSRDLGMTNSGEQLLRAHQMMIDAWYDCWLADQQLRSEAVRCEQESSSSAVRTA
ncbi:MAG: hypothetical protein MZV49_07745, partial [Rhodopseudomonas palustris]|nr:hypothetical protein [Rhodopseudomonas palustris]